MPQCDECSDVIERTHKIYKQLKFCHKCYMRVFKKRVCPSCGKVARLSKYDNSAICKKCENNRPCIRCQRINYPIGKITNHGPVCNSCSVYFREFQACERCGTLSQKLSRISRFADNLRVCPKCATRDYKTCPRCKRYRLLEVESLSGQMFCKKCLNYSTGHCQVCRHQIPAGRGDLCERCSWHQSLERRIVKLVNNLENHYLRECFKNYAKWLEQKLGPHKTALVVNKHIGFFEETSDLWTNKVPIYRVLLQRLRSSGLRKYVLPMQWLIKVHNLKIDIKAKEFCSELDQLKKLASICPESSFSAQVIQDYYDLLINRANEGKISIRSARLAMKPASVLMLQMSKSRFDIPRIWHIKHYLSLHPGQAAALVGFINFLNKKFDANLNISFILNFNFLKDIRKQKLEKEILKLIRDAEISFSLLRWVRVCLKYFHKLNDYDSKKVTLSMINEVEDGYIVSYQNERYWLPNRSLIHHKE